MATLCVRDVNTITHTALNRDLDEVRLIALQPCGDSRHPIECKILNVRLSDQPQYEALSYMWGSDDDSKIIDIEGREFQIRQNLRLALKQLRGLTQERILRIDALCINQVNISERNNQVGFMSLIYSRAMCVVAWLGPEVDGSHEAISFLKQIDDGSIEVERLDRPRLRGKWSSVLKLCELQYWTRLWIIQELVLAPRVLLCWGRDELPADSITRIRDLLMNTQKARTWDFIVVKEFHKSLPARLLQLRNRVNSPALPPLVQVPFKFKEAACKDIRDKIFGLRRLSIDCCTTQLPVDYSWTATEVYQHAFRHYHEEHNVLRNRFEEAAALAYDIHAICKDPTKETLARDTVYVVE
jgi:hypothetical protein